MWEPNQFKAVTARNTKRIWPVFSFGIFFILLIYTMPWLMESFAPTGDTLDVSWAWMLGYGIQHHLQWGKSILFTYGPLGFIANPYFYSDHLLWGIASVARLLSWLLFGLGFALILFRHLSEKKSFTYFSLPIIIAWLVGASLVDLATQSAFMGILLLIFSLDDKNKKLAVISLLLSGILLAFGSLIKSTSLIISFFIMIIYPILFWYAQQRKQKIILSLLPMIVFVLSFLAIWALTGQDIAHLPAYIYGTWAIASGYTPAMSIHGKGLQTVVALFMLLLLVAATISLIMKKDRVTITQAIPLGVMAFWAWKEGFTRHDPGFGGGHAMAFFGVALLVAAVGLIILSDESQKLPVINVAGVYLLALIFALPGTLLFSGNEITNYKNFASLITSKSHRITQQQEQTTAIMNQFRLDPMLLKIVNGHSVNIIPWNLMIAQGYHMNLVASPVIQAYSVYTPYLDHLNAQQIWKGHGADKIIYTAVSILKRNTAI